MDKNFQQVQQAIRKTPELADVHLPGNVKSNGDHRRHLRAGEPSSYRYDDDER